MDIKENMQIYIYICILILRTNKVHIYGDLLAKMLNKWNPCHGIMIIKSFFTVSQKNLYSNIYETKRNVYRITLNYFKYFP